MKLLGLVRRPGNAAESHQMTITYPNGMAFEAVLMACGNDILCAGVPGDDDVHLFTLVSGRWISGGGNPVKIELAGQRQAKAEVSNDTECVCPKQLAAHVDSGRW